MKNKQPILKLGQNTILSLMKHLHITCKKKLIKKSVLIVVFVVVGLSLGFFLIYNALNPTFESGGAIYTRDIFGRIISAQALSKSSYLNYQQTLQSTGEQTSEKINIMSADDYSKAHKYLGTLFLNQINYSQKVGGIQTATVDFGNVAITSYKYEVASSTFENGYEGSTWTVNLADEVNSIAKLKKGKQKLLTCAGFFECGVGTVEGHQLGSILWGSIDQFFQPAGSWSRIYYTFDKTTKQIIYVEATFYDIYKGDLPVTYEKHPEVYSAIRQIESHVLTF